MLLLSHSGEIYIKSRRTRSGFERALRANVVVAASGVDPAAKVVTVGQSRWGIETEHPSEVAQAVARVFGIYRVQAVEEFRFTDFEDLVRRAGDLARPAVTGKTFAVRVRRAGAHDWKSPDAAAAIGGEVYDDSAGVDLSNPQVEARFEVHNERAFYVVETFPGQGGLPLGTQGRTLVLLSGGFDSVVAAWMLMRRGCSVDYLHFKLDCAQSDHALAVGHELHRLWGYGQRSIGHVLDFQPVKDALQAEVEPRFRQVVLKQLMMQAAARLATSVELGVLVTGESIGQVSSQTLSHLAEIDRVTELPILRPLVGINKEQIIDLSREIGTYELSARAQEVCDLSGGAPVAVSATRAALDTARAKMPTDVIDKAFAGWETVGMDAWSPGVPLDSHSELILDPQPSPV